MNILDKIIDAKKQEVAMKKKIIPVDAWKKIPYYDQPKISLKHSLGKAYSSGIIAEFKRKSPSKGVINDKAKVADVVTDYNRYAAGISILTDEIFFGGTNDDMLVARGIATVPLLRKDFIIDEYQLYEARGIGADVILLIAAQLSRQQVKQLSSTAKRLNLEVLLEIHSEEELDHICDEVDIVGVNNRNLKTFNVDINTSLQLINRIPENKTAISESGISDVNVIKTLKQAGFKGFLIGEAFMKAKNPGRAFEEFLSQLKANENAD